MAVISLEKSTIVRIRNSGLRRFFRTAEVVAPGLAGRVARDLWFSVPAPMAPAPLPEGGEAFTVTAQGAVVRGRVYGEGPVVYLVHGWAGRGSQLASFVQPLVATGHRVVLFDAPAHGDSDPGPAGPGRSHGVEFGKALDAVFARYGPARAVVAHSLGTIATYLSLRFGWLGTERLVLLAPVVAASGLVDEFQAALGFGARTRRAFEREVGDFVGIPLAEFDARVQAAHTDPVPTLVLHDLGDRQAPYVDAQRLVRALPDARLVTTDGLRHRRILADPDVVSRVVEFVGARERAAAA
jgi:pimeloyl-ACP methyl ester carboxylesterase